MKRMGDYGNGLRLSVRLSFRNTFLSISPEPFEKFSLNFGQIFTSMSRCAEPISQPCQLKVKVTGQGHGFEPWISCPLHISCTPGRFSLNFGYMFASVRRCAELITQPCRHKVKVKVTVQCHRFEPWISCPLCISYTSGRIFFKNLVKCSP